MTGVLVRESRWRPEIEAHKGMWVKENRVLCTASS